MVRKEPDLQLTGAQLGVWYALKSGASISAYNFADYIKIAGALDPVLFETALRRVVMESEALRVRFVERNDVPSQQIIASPDWSLAYQDVSLETDPISAVEAWMNRDIARPIDPCRGPFFTFALFKAASDEFLWYARYHHLVMDYFGALLIARRVASVYSALNGRSPIDRTPFGSLAAIVEEDAAYRESRRFKSDRQFWLNSMSGYPEPLNLSKSSLPASTQCLRLATDIPGRLSRNCNASLSMSE
jgi:nonribosomal peptide synthetase DhbF